MKADKIVKVSWLDSLSSSGWTLADDINEGITGCITYGFLVEDEADHITVAQTLGMKPEQYCGMISIPRASITFMQTIDGPARKEYGVDSNEPYRNGNTSATDGKIHNPSFID